MKNMIGSYKTTFLVNYEKTEYIEACLSDLGLRYSYTAAYKTNDTSVDYRLWTVWIPKRGFDPIYERIRTIMS